MNARALVGGPARLILRVLILGHGTAVTGLAVHKFFTLFVLLARRTVPCKNTPRFCAGATIQRSWRAGELCTRGARPALVR